MLWVLNERVYYYVFRSEILLCLCLHGFGVNDRLKPPEFLSMFLEDRLTVYLSVSLCLPVCLSDSCPLGYPFPETAYNNSTKISLYDDSKAQCCVVVMLLVR